MPSMHEIVFSVPNGLILPAAGTAPAVNVHAFQDKTMILVAAGGSFNIEIFNDGTNFIEINSAPLTGVELISTDISQSPGFNNARAFPRAIKFIRIVTMSGSASASAVLMARQL